MLPVVVVVQVCHRLFRPQQPLAAGPMPDRKLLEQFWSEYGGELPVVEAEVALCTSWATTVLSMRERLRVGHAVPPP